MYKEKIQLCTFDKKFRLFQTDMTWVWKKMEVEIPAWVLGIPVLAFLSRSLAVHEMLHISISLLFWQQVGKSNYV